MLTVNALSFAYGHRSLFENLSFELTRGEAIHLTGSNGTGKSTLLSILAGLRKAQTGDIVLKGADGKALRDRRRQIGYLASESNGLYLKMSALDNLKFWGSLKGERPEEQKILDCLSMWGLTGPGLAKNFPVSHFSTGMRRRLALARLCLSGTRCWLLDEPVYGLDSRGITLFRSALSEHLAAGGGAILVSHDPCATEELKTRELPLTRAEANP